MLKNLKSKQWLILLAAVFLLSTFYYFQNKDNNKHPNELTTSAIQISEKKRESVEYKIDSIIENSITPQDLVNTYQGTQADGAIHLDANGNVVIDKDLRRLFGLLPCSYW